MTPSLFEPRWIALIEHLAFADQVAYRMLLQAPFPNDSEAMDEDDAFQLIARRLPEYHDIETRIERFGRLLTGSPEAAEMWESLSGDLPAHVQEYAFLLGWAFGARLGASALIPPPATARTNGGAQ